MSHMAGVTTTLRTRRQNGETSALLEMSEPAASVCFLSSASMASAVVGTPAEASSGRKST
ncbi:hypothetical protein D3C75_1381050 [compost metagenome]